MNKAYKNDYSVILGNSKESFSLEEKLVNQCLQQKVDGILMSLASDTSQYKHLENIIANATISVLFDNFLSKPIKNLSLTHLLTKIIFSNLSSKSKRSEIVFDPFIEIGSL